MKSPRFRYRKLTGSTSTSTRAVPRTAHLLQPGAQQRLHRHVAPRLQQQPAAVPAAQDRQRRRGRAEHQHPLAARRRAAQLARQLVGRLGACRR